MTKTENFASTCIWTSGLESSSCILYSVFKINGSPVAPGDQKLVWTSKIWPWASKNYSRLYKEGNFLNISGRLRENFSLKHCCTGISDTLLCNQSNNSRKAFVYFRYTECAVSDMSIIPIIVIDRTDMSSYECWFCAHRSRRFVTVIHGVCNCKSFVSWLKNMIWFQLSTFLLIQMAGYLHFSSKFALYIFNFHLKIIDYRVEFNWEWEYHLVEWSDLSILNIPTFVSCPTTGVSYPQYSNICLTLVGNPIVDHSGVVGASPVWHCSNYIFIPDLTYGFNGLGKDNCKMRWETFGFWNLMHLILEVWQYIDSKLAMGC